MRAFSKDSPPITYLSDCLSIHSSIWNNTHRKDLNLQVFLEYEEELGVRGKNVKEKISEFFGIVQVCNHKSQNVSCDPREVLPFRWRWGSCCLQAPNMMVMPTLRQKRYMNMNMTWLVEIWQESLHLVMDQWIQYKLGKQYLWKKSYTTLEIEPRTYSYPGRIGYPNYVSWVKKKVFKSWKQKFKWPLKMISRQKMKFQTQPKNAIFQNWLKTVSDFSFWKVQL